ncbi:unnamed protein product [Mesocestoides corti]|uniref:EAF domain-containing protein n=1 Tax=Mesocestoides corti TaxID=53468 RepID=A0A0R3UHW0_MESCO|nr:unnamed protein product [Mesocestoides corti]
MPLQGTYEVKLGQSFIDPSQNYFMTMRCNFLPASVDKDQPGTIKINDDNEVGVRLPNVPGAEQPSTLFKGNIRPVQKECILIYNKATNELTLERISKAAQLKKIRDGSSCKRPKVSQQPPVVPNPTTASGQVSKPKVRTMSESSSDEDKHPSKPKPKSPLLHRPPAVVSNSQTILKRSTLSSSSSSSDSEGEVPNSPVQKFGNRQPSSLSSLSDIDDTKVPQSQAKPALNLDLQSSASLQRALVANDLHLSESESDDDSL